MLTDALALIKVLLSACHVRPLEWLSMLYCLNRIITWVNDLKVLEFYKLLSDDLRPVVLMLDIIGCHDNRNDGKASVVLVRF